MYLNHLHPNCYSLSFSAALPPYSPHGCIIITILLKCYNFLREINIFNSSVNQYLKIWRP